MINLNLFRAEFPLTSAAICKKDPDFDVNRLAALDKQVRALQLEVEQLRQKKNECAQAAKGGLTEQIRQESITLSEKLKTVEAELEIVHPQFMALYLACPNITEQEVPFGGKSENLSVRTWGDKPHFAYPIKNHVQLGAQLGWFDFDTAATMTKSNFVLYKGDAVRLMYALTQFMLKHNQTYGYNLVLPPYMVNRESLIISGNLPKFADQVYKIEGDQLYLIPTAEVNCANMHRDTIFSINQLPVRYTAWTSCFRKEAGTYGSAERGLIRIHQFEKVELYAYCLPEESSTELDRMLGCAEELLKQLGLHYRVSLLAAQDCSFASAKTYDIEVWMPGQNAYYEVSSCSNCTDFQARRGSIRYRVTDRSKPELVHTLNGSSLALPRLIVALMETYQQPDGSIAIPEVLKPFMLV